MGEIQNAGKEAKKLFETFLKEFKGSLVANWTVVSGGQYDKYSQKYVGSVESPQTLSIDAIVESDKIQFKYEKYGVDEKTDIIAMVKISLQVPPQTATYTRVGDPRSYSLVDVHFEGNYGTDSTGKQLYAFKVLHLRAS